MYFGTRATIEGQDAAQHGAQRQVASYEKAPFVRTAQHKLERTTGLMDALRAPLPLRLKPSGEFLKTAHWAVFLTEFHLIGSNPRNLTRKQNRPGNRLTCNIQW